MPSAASQTSFDLLQAKIEHLERERVELSLQLHQQSEKERTKKLQMEKMEVTLKNTEKDKEILSRALEDAQTAIKKLKEDIVGSKHLQEQIVALKTAASVTSREIKKLEDDLLKVHKEKADIFQENDQLTATLTGLQETNEKQKEEMTMVRMEMEAQQRTHAETESANDAAMTALKEEYHATHSALVAAISTHEHDMETLVREKQSMMDEIVELKKQVADGITGGRRNKGEDGMNMDNDHDDDDDITALGLTEALTVIEKLKKNLFQSELKRKQLHNTLQELRGNIRVFVRCRPFLRGELLPSHPIPAIDITTLFFFYLSSSISSYVYLLTYDTGDGEEFDNNDGTINDNPVRYPSTHNYPWLIYSYVLKI